jgi:hypothetical protein
MILSLLGYFYVIASWKWDDEVVNVKVGWIAAGLMLAFASVSCAGGASVVLLPSQDNTIIQWSAETPDPNPLLANGQGDVYVGRTTQDGQEEATISIRRGLVQFDVAGAVPNGMKIVAATLTMRDVRGRNGDPIVTLHRVLSPWGEGGSFFEGGQGSPAEDGDVTWLHASFNAQSPGASLAWETPGGDFLETASAAAVVTDDLGEGQMFAWTGAELVSDLETWLADPNANFGWLLRGDESRGQSAKRFNSGESSEAPNVPPRLEIEYTPVLAGDYNDDGIVDAADYPAWRDGLGGATRLKNETATLGTVTVEDYAVWKSHFGSLGVGAGTAASVPEPAASGICWIGIWAAGWYFNRLIR